MKKYTHEDVFIDERSRITDYLYGIHERIGKGKDFKQLEWVLDLSGYNEHPLKIGEGAFRKNRITKVVLPSWLDEVDDEAFKGNPITEVEFKHRLDQEVILKEDSFRNCNICKVFLPYTPVFQKGVFNDNPVEKVIAFDLLLPKNDSDASNGRIFDEKKGFLETYRNNGVGVYETNNNGIFEYKGSIPEKYQTKPYNYYEWGIDWVASEQ